MTNQELAAALWLCAGDGQCRECPKFDPTNLFDPACVASLQRDAAAALENHETHIAALQREIEGLRKRVELAQKSQWVSVNKQQPERWIDPDTSKLVNYLIYSPDFGIDIGNYHKRAKCWIRVGLRANVTYWANIPEPPSTERVE